MLLGERSVVGCGGAYVGKWRLVVEGRERLRNGPRALGSIMELVALRADTWHRKEEAPFGERVGRSTGVPLNILRRVESGVRK
jgi:hypothetical protein